jgi:hypothetical protein
MNYKETQLWKVAFKAKDDGHDEIRFYLEESLERTRSNSIGLLEIIRTDFPSLTIHDISHVDSLWQVASVIAGPNYYINPLEAFVLGCAFIFHDAALSYYSVGGKKRLRNTTEWKDYYADYCKRDDICKDGIADEADFQAIRFLHGKYAETLCEQIFERHDGSKFFIIEDVSLRKHLGSIIGKIAASHHWNADQITSLGFQLPALSGFPQEWRINPVKLACILRCSDAGHFDAGRAPDHILRLLSLNGVSRNHWIAQNKLSQIDVDIEDSSQLLIASNIDFEKNDFAAWNVVYDAVCVFDHELHSCNAILSSMPDPAPFRAQRVKGAESREELSHYVKTKGWIPCDANIHISNIESIIKNLGGEKLYGKDRKIETVLRELIQNARDAICARRNVEEGFEGHIEVSLEHRDTHSWLIVRDDGIGMSITAIKDYLLNFGDSYWVSDLAKIEYSGLRSSSFNSVGKFGIGFYSVFMISSNVIVESRKFDNSIESTTVIHFPNGLCLRPIVSFARGTSMFFSTSVCLEIDTTKVSLEKSFRIHSGYSGIPDFDVPFCKILSNIVCGLDVDVYFQDGDSPKQLIHRSLSSSAFNPQQWLKDITFAEYHEGTKYVDYIDANYDRLRPVVYNGETIGLAALNTLYQHHNSYLDILSVGGLTTFTHSSSMGDFIGHISVDPDTAKRDGRLNKEYLKDWAIEQYQLLLNKGLTQKDLMWLPYIVSKYGIDMSSILLLVLRDKQKKIHIVNIQTLLSLVSCGKSIVFALSDFSQERIDTYTDIERTLSLLTDNELLFIPVCNSDFLNLTDCDEINIKHCIKSIADELDIKIQFQIMPRKIYTHISGISSSVVLSLDSMQ